MLNDSTGARNDVTHKRKFGNAIPKAALAHTGGSDRKIGDRAAWPIYT